MRTTRGRSDIWAQSLDGAPPRPLTQLASGRIVQYAWSASGRHLVYGLGRMNNAVVLIRHRR